MASEPVDALVLGAGIAGASAALALARVGFGSVVVLDPSTPAAGATGRAAGIVTEQMWNPWDLDVVRASRTEYARLASRHDPSAYRTNGFVRWTARSDIAAVLDESAERWRSWGVRVRELTSSELAAVLPSVRADDLVRSILVPDDGVVAPSRTNELLVEEARQAGVRFEFGRPVGPLAYEQGRWSASSGGTAYAGRVGVVAAGAWSKKILAEAGHPLPLVPYRTQAALLRPSGPAGGSFPSWHDLDTDVYGRPEDAGRILAGDGTESVEADPESFVTGGDQRFLGHLAETFAGRLPGWSDAALLRAWAGVCVATPDRRPLVGPVPDAPGLFALTGFNGFGVMRAAGAAERLARAIVEPKEAASLLGPVLPARFRSPPTPFLPRPGFTLEGGTDPRF